MGTDCPTCNPRSIGISNNRDVAFVSRLKETSGNFLRMADGKGGVIVTRSCYPRTRHGQSFVVCACETGAVRIGSSAAIVHGRATKALVEAFESVPDPIVIVALDEASSPTGRRVTEIRKRCEEQGRELVVLQFSKRPTVLRMRPLEDQRVRRIRGEVEFHKRFPEPEPEDG